MTQETVHVRANTTGRAISVIPHMLGYQPAAPDIVVLGIAEQPGGRAKIGFGARYDMSERGRAGEAADHAQAVLNREGMRRAIIVGYGPGQAVTPNMDVFRDTMARSGIGVHEAARADEGRWWSYLCTDPSCHPVEGTPLEADQVDAETRNRLGEAKASRQAIADSIAPLTGEQAAAQREIDGRAAGARRQLLMRRDGEGLYRVGVGVVDQAVTAARCGAGVSDEDHARLAQYMTDIRVRDAAWSRMDPQHAGQHQLLWTETVRRAQPGTVAGPASLLAFTAAQQGHGALANVALDRALDDDPGYSMARLFGHALDAGVKPDELMPPMTPEETDAAYGYPGRDRGVEPTPDPGSDAAPLAGTDHDVEAGS